MQKINSNNIIKSKLFLFSGLLIIIIFLSLFIFAWVAKKDDKNIEDVTGKWTYEGQEGGKNWSDVNKSYIICNNGKEQSPIDISNVIEKDLPNIVFNYQPSAINILNNGHTIQVNYDKGSFINLDGIKYNVIQFHYHTPSEHAVDGKLFDAEIHILHKNSDNEIAVVSILLKEGVQNKALDSFIKNIPSEKSNIIKSKDIINLKDLLPQKLNTFRYVGSLTMPPCSEHVNWIVITNPIEVSKEQLSELTKLFNNHNSRSIQKLNNRKIIRDSAV